MPSRSSIELGRVVELSDVQDGSYVFDAKPRLLRKLASGSLMKQLSRFTSTTRERPNSAGAIRTRLPDEQQISASPHDDCD